MKKFLHNYEWNKKINMKKLLLLPLIYTSLAFSAKFPTPVAATFYPIYNSGTNQYIKPTMNMPFDKVSTIFVAFAHAYPLGNGAILKLEEGQPEEPHRLKLLYKTAKAKNPEIKLLISLGWGHNDWTYINDDIENDTNYFAPSVVRLIREYKLDGFDIDDESINGSSGYISQLNFYKAIKKLRRALDEASLEDKKPYYLTITPAFGQANVTKENMNYFDLINTQNYGGSYPSDFTKLGYPANQITQGVLSENSCNSTLPDSSKGAGIFNWTMSSDRACDYHYTREIARDVGYAMQLPSSRRTQ